ncbi:MAG: RHS repeat-associated core domain-containing protein [Gemmatimonadaceae bacterium]
MSSQCPPYPNPCPDTTFTLSQQYGTVTYGYDGVIDRPIVLYRKYYGIDSTSYGEATIYPQYNHRGDASGSTDNESPLALDRHVNWPALDTRAYGFIGVGAQARTWFGSVIHQGQEATGLQFKRNRYYNAERGAFTQEDPIGLEGGLNLYGFANGDPINFSDPFGLQADTTRRRCDFITGESCSPAVKELVKKDQPREEAGLADALLLIGGLEAQGAKQSSRLVTGAAQALSRRLGKSSVVVPIEGGFKRIDLVGRTHAGVPTPHVVTYRVHTNPLTGASQLKKTFGGPATRQDVIDAAKAAGIIR